LKNRHFTDNPAVNAGLQQLLNETPSQEPQEEFIPDKAGELGEGIFPQVRLVKK